jgi:hypothetical protein
LTLYQAVKTRTAGRCALREAIKVAIEAATNTNTITITME